MNPLKGADIIAELQADILRLQGFNSVASSALDIDWGPIKNAFPNASFPLGAVHEFLASGNEGLAATDGFITGILSSLMQSKGTVLWISASRKIFPPALKNFGVEPDRFVFIGLSKEKDVLWAMDEALKCGAVSAVIGELREISFNDSRRLQLAVEQSQVTGFVIRNNYKSINTTACVSRWKITSLPSETVDDLPGIGFPKWQVELLRMRNGKPGVWHMQWVNGKLIPVYTSLSIWTNPQKKVG
ncbi:MAG TPA: Error-prone repair protein ImuA [Ohtaekwangia sp.]|uniref:ImuA family protein n=1 Tax=Ohtaekwangia sp. TaxID=2066019 RepID=UPI002F95A3A3